MCLKRPESGLCTRSHENMRKLSMVQTLQSHHEKKCIVRLAEERPGEVLRRHDIDLARREGETPHGERSSLCCLKRLEPTDYRTALLCAHLPVRTPTQPASSADNMRT